MTRRPTITSTTAVSSVIGHDWFPRLKTILRKALKSSPSSPRFEASQETPKSTEQTVPKSRFLLLKLPAELRNQIWNLVFYPSEVVCLCAARHHHIVADDSSNANDPNDAKDPKDAGDANKSKTRPSRIGLASAANLCIANQQIYCETIPLLYDCPFEISVQNCNEFLLNLGANRRYLKHLICRDVLDDEKFMPPLKMQPLQPFFLQKMDRLEKIEFVIGVHDLNFFSRAEVYLRGPVGAELWKTLAPWIRAIGQRERKPLAIFDKALSISTDLTGLNLQPVVRPPGEMAAFEGEMLGYLKRCAQMDQDMGKLNKNFKL